MVREYDEVSRLDAQKTTMLLAVKKKIKEATDDIDSSEVQKKASDDIA